MKNIELCKKCFYGRIWETTDGEVVGRSCELPPSIFINNNSKGLYKNDTDNSCYDFVENNSSTPNKVIVSKN